MNIRVVDGRLTKDAEIKVNRTTGTKFLSFTLANNDFIKGQEVQTYFNVITHDPFVINKHETENFYTKGKLVVVTGRPNENMTVSNGKTYLNRNIIAYSIERGTLSRSERQVSEGETAVYRDVAPVAAAAPVCEAPRVPQPQAVAPSVAPVAPQVTTPRAEIPVAAPQTPVYTTEIPVAAPQAVANNVPNVEDDLPF
jgi:single-stranded DNA-binding protein